ncbi:MAG TPA: hypothetical protein PK812_10590 [Beijerinckiaceae bacterium]|nr:hypothetical protein [Beijerinckiaceae bacterium]
MIGLAGGDDVGDSVLWVALTVGLFVVPVAIGSAVIARLQQTFYRRLEFIRSYRWPPALLDQLKKHHPDFTRKETALIAQGLKQFFIAHLRSGRAYVAMPSQAADELWHEFILYTRAYQEFCDQAFGRFLHHTPAVALAPARQRTNEGLRRVWWWSCKEESINPTNPTRLPLLFALDKKLNIPNGYHYTADCEQLRKNGVPGTQCGGDFSSSSFDGSTTGMGDGGTGVNDGADGGGSDGGGCGGD